MFVIGSNICMEELISMKNSERILILYPYELKNEKILKENISKMINVVREYIKDSESYSICINTIPNMIWDSQKDSPRNKSNEHKRKAEELAEVMNDGIDSYHWFISKNFDECIDGIHYKVDYVVYLEKYK